MGLPAVRDLLVAWGPGFLFLFVVAETCFVTGLVVPASAATAAAVALAGQGVMPLEAVLLAAVSGAVVGDSVGFWIGRRGGEHLLPTSGRFGRAVGRARAEAERFFGGHPFYSVTLARLVSFVRTVMPMAAGMSSLTYRRFLAFELAGVAGWLLIYALLGFGAGEGLERLVALVGVGWTAVFVVVGVTLWIVARRRTAGTPGPEEEGPC